MLLFLVVVMFGCGVVQSQNVVTLTDANFDTLVNQSPYALVEFYSPRCGHCVHFAPEYENLARAVGSTPSLSSVLVAKIDATIEKQSASKYQIQGFPTFKLFIGGVSGQIIPYSGTRTVEAFLRWLAKKTSSPITTLTSPELLLSFVVDNPVTVIGFLPETNQNSIETFRSVAQQFDDAIFGLVVDSTLFGLEAPDSIKLSRQFEPNPVRLTDFSTRTTDQIHDWLLSETTPPVNDLFGPNGFQKLSQQKKPIVVGIESLTSPASKEFIDSLTDLANQYKGRLLFTYFSGPRVGSLLDEVGSSKKVFPTYIGIITKTTSRGPQFVPIDDEEPITSEKLSAWLESLISDTYKVRKKSQPVPESNSEPVYVLVHSTFEELVIKSKKLVLVEFYAPWCTHCKTFAPIYESLGREYKNHPQVLIAKLDGTANYVDPELGVQGFPTLILFRNGNPTIYNGARTQAALSQFIQENLESAEDFDDDFDKNGKDEL